jgi:NADH pyrophosphatase NudC (nudix superfamily)
MIESPEIKAKVLEWQRRYNIPDGDPAMALIDLLEIYKVSGIPSAVPYAQSPTASPSAAPVVLDEAILEQVRSQLTPAIERLTFQTQELKQKLEAMALDTFAEQIATYHEGIDYCTKKLDVVKKENDSITMQLTKTANSINPITRTAVIVLVVVAAVIGWVAGVALS